MSVDTYRCPDDRCNTEQLVAASAVATNVCTEQGRRYCHVVCLCPECGTRIHLELPYETVRTIDRFLMALPQLYDVDVNWDLIFIEFEEIVTQEFGW